MKRLFVLYIFMAFCLSALAENILEYRCSDGVYLSYLTVDDSGHVAINESCFEACPMHTYSRSAQLSEANLVNLKNIIRSIEADANMSFSARIGNSNKGVLGVYQGSKQIIILQVSADSYATIGNIKKNTSIETKFFRELLAPLVKMQMHFEWTAVPDPEAF